MGEIQIIKRSEFPQALREIPDPPERLYVRGTLPRKDTLFLSVVGSRKYTDYGKEACEKIIRELSGYPIVIVSGLALGIDGIAHKTALQVGLKTIAFPGSGLNDEVIYPATNFQLARKIIESGGALISEFEPDFRATPYAFPQRNRLMAGVSRGTLVIEAGEKSGTLITARLTLDYNRDVFVVPGPIFSSSSVGSNRFLKEGAIPVTSGADILEYWGIQNEAREENSAEKTFEECSSEEKKVLALLQNPRSRDELIHALQMPVRDINILLSAMEIKGIIKEIGGEMRRNY